MSKYRLSTLAPFLLLNALPLSALAWGGEADEPPLLLYYYERPPFHYAGDKGQVIGLVAEAAEETLRRAKLRFLWVSLPANRILSTLHSEKEIACSPGWYSTPERRADFQYSKALLPDKPLVALVRADFAVPDRVTAKAFFDMPHVRLLVKQNFSQGAYLNTLIAHIPPARIQHVILDLPQMIRMLRADRADVVFSTEAEASFLVREAGLPMSDFKIVRFPDILATEYRYMLCGRGVSAETMARIDAAISLQKPVVR